MKHLLVTVALLVGFAGCDGGAGVEDAPDGGFKTDVTPTGAALIPTTPFPYAGTVASGYTPQGVTANLGRIQCGTDSLGHSAGFEPGGTLTCWPPTEVSGRGGICGVLLETVVVPGNAGSTVLSVCSATAAQYAESTFDMAHGGPLAGLFPYAPGTCAPMPACGTYAPGTLRVWSMDDPRYVYLGYAGSVGYVCLPNIVPYVIPC